MTLDELVNMPKLLARAGLVSSVGAGQRAIAHGDVYIQRWNIGVSEAVLPRWVLRGVTVTVGPRRVRISNDGYRIQPERIPIDERLAG